MMIPASIPVALNMRFLIDKVTVREVFFECSFPQPNINSPHFPLKSVRILNLVQSILHQLESYWEGPELFITVLAKIIKFAAPSASAIEPVTRHY
jgi:hypothetical protein